MKWKRAELGGAANRRKRGPFSPLADLYVGPRHEGWTVTVHEGMGGVSP